MTTPIIGGGVEPSRHVSPRGVCLICGCSTLFTGFMSCKGHAPDELPAVDPGPSDAEREAIASLGKLSRSVKRMLDEFPALAKKTRRRRSPSGKPPKCPKCRAFPCRYTEEWAGHVICFQADEAGVPASEGDMGMGSPVAVVAHCGCGHHWRMRGIIQITNILGAGS